MINAELKQYCERLARLAEEKKTIAADEKEIKAEAESKGFDKALIAKTVSLMLKSDKARAKALEQHELFDTYLVAAGLIAEPAPDVDPEPEKMTLGNTDTIHQPPSVPPIEVAVDQGEVAHTASPVQIEEPDLPDIPAHMDRRKPKPVYTPEQLLGAG